MEGETVFGDSTSQSHNSAKEMNSLKEIKRKYDAYVECLRLLIEQKKVLPENLLEYLLHLPAFTNGESLCLLSDKASELYKKTTTIEIFNFLATECSSFLNCDILQYMVSNYEIMEDREELKYYEHLKAFIEKHEISDLVALDHPLKNKKDFKELKCEIEYTKRLVTVMELKNAIVDIFDLSPAALHIVDVTEGSVIVTLLIPASIADVLFSTNSDMVFTTEQLALFKAALVIWLKCSGQNFVFSKDAFTADVCMDCFYKYRTYPNIPECKHSHRVIVDWNKHERRFETTNCRPFPTTPPRGVKRSIAMCDPHRGNCKNEKCTFAHGRMEQKAWNSALRQQREWEAMLEIQEIQASQMSDSSQHSSMPVDLSIEKQSFLEYQPTPSEFSPVFLYSQPEFSPRQREQSFELPIKRESQRADTYAAAGETFEKRLKEDLKLEDIKIPLSRTNYKRKFHNLICWEEMTHISILTNKCDQKCNLVLYKRGFVPEWIHLPKHRPQYRVRYGYLENLDADQISYATQASPAAFIVSTDRKFEVKLKIIQEPSYEHLYIIFYEDSTQNLSSIISQKELSEEKIALRGLCIEFEVKHSYFNNLVKSVNRIKGITIERILPELKDFYQPVSSNFLKQLQRLLPDIAIDQNQLDALHAIVSCNKMSPPILVNGSFGSGKTRLIAVATYYIIQNGIDNHEPVRVLVCAHHQVSADHFIEEYFGSMFSNKEHVELVRVTSQSHRSPPNSKFSDLYISSRDYENSYYKKSHWENSKYLVLVTTFLTAPHLSKTFEDGFFTHILIDEGSQSREPEAISPLCLAGPETQVVIAGDSCQVGPSLLVLGKDARENGLKYSLMERLQQHYEQLGGIAQQHMISLNTNYRCHLDLVQIPNRLFYGSKIQSVPRDAAPHPKAKFPLIFVCSSTTSAMNSKLEAQLILEQVGQFTSLNWPKSWGKKSLNDICIATASQRQLVRTRNLARQKYLRLLTTYQIQGEEFRAVFLSTIEPVDHEGNTSDPTKSPCDPYVFNTVLTRSKSLVVVVGSPFALLKIEDHMKKVYGRKAECWSSYLRLCLEKETLIIPDSIIGEPNDKKQFELQLKTALYNGASRQVSQLGALASSTQIQSYAHAGHTLSEQLSRPVTQSGAVAGFTYSDSIKPVTPSELPWPTLPTGYAYSADYTSPVQVTTQPGTYKAPGVFVQVVTESELPREMAYTTKPRVSFRAEPTSTGESQYKHDAEMDFGHDETTSTAASMPQEEVLVTIGDLTLFQDNIGNGAFASVHRATYRKEKCAAKMLLQHARDMMIGATEGNIQQAAKRNFKKECEFLKELQHENIVRYIATAFEPKAGLPILVMEVMDFSLRKFIPEYKPLSLDLQLTICKGVSCGLHYLHSQDIIHRDLCDDNILLTKPPQLEVKISDFGMSRILDYESMSATMTAVGHRKGYLPPEGEDVNSSEEEEDYYDKARYSHHLDIYSFGAVATQTMQSADHFKARAELKRTFKQVKKNHPLREIIAKCIDKDPKRRPSAESVSTDITKILGIVSFASDATS